MSTLITLADLSERIDYGLTTSADVHADGPRFLRITDIEDWHVDWQSVPRCQASELERQKYALEDGDIVVARTGASTGRSAWIQLEEEAVFASYLIRFRVKDTFDSRFVAYVLTSNRWRDYVYSAAHGKSAQPNMSASAMADFSFNCPPLDTQRAIAEVLGALDDKIAANRQTCRALTDLADALFLSHRVTASRTERLADVVSTQYGVTTSATTTGSHRLIRVTDINKQRWIDWSTAPTCEVDDAEVAKYSVREGDILAARMADPGKVAYVDESAPPAVFASYLVRLVPDDPAMALYLYHYMASAEYQSYANAASSGSVQKNMNAKVIVDTGVPIPSMSELSSFNAEAKALRGKLGATLRETQQLAATRDALLPALMSGKLRVKDAERHVEEMV